MIDDIEDITAPIDDPSSAQNRVSLNSVAIKTFRKRNNANSNKSVTSDKNVSGATAESDLAKGSVEEDGAGQQDTASNSADYFLPGKSSVYVKTWGCGHNNSGILSWLN
jgi:hypothetical protein